MAETFLTYRQHMWLKAAVVAALVCIAGYLLSAAKTPAYGGTILGLGYGILGFLAILVLLFYGMRKRSYWSTPGTPNSAHPTLRPVGSSRPRPTAFQLSVVKIHL